MRRGQAMVESMLAVIFVTFLLFFSIHIVRLLTTKILLDHAAARAARARAVGFNDFMCRKSANVAMLPVAGASALPSAKLDVGEELARLSNYLASEDPARARAILDYEWWDDAALWFRESGGLAPCIDATVNIKTDSFAVGGSASVESHYPFYMNEF